jgi:hypothetical protein
MKVQTGCLIASCVSGISLLGCLLLIANIASEVQQFWLELDQEIGVLRVETDDLWHDILSLSKSRRRRQAAGYEGGQQSGGAAPASNPSGGGAGPNYEAAGGTSNPSGPGGAGPTGSSGPGVNAPGVPGGAQPPSIPPSLSGGEQQGAGPCSEESIDLKRKF